MGKGSPPVPLVDCELVQVLWESMEAPQKLKKELPYDPPSFLLSVCSKKTENNSETYMHNFH